MPIAEREHEGPFKDRPIWLSFDHTWFNDNFELTI